MECKTLYLAGPIQMQIQLNTHTRTLMPKSVCVCVLLKRRDGAKASFRDA